MIKNYLKIAWRNLAKDRLFTCLNIVGLSTGLACAIMIYLWVNDEWRINRFNQKDSQLYQVLPAVKTSYDVTMVQNTPGLLAQALATEMPEVEYATSVIPAGWFSNKGLISCNEVNLRAGAQFVSKDYFNVFSCNFLEGSKSDLFSDKHRIAISKDLAIQLFGGYKNITGKTVEWNQEGFNGSYMISGVFEKWPSNATGRFDLIFNYDLFLEKNPKLQNWNNNDPSTYIILKRGTDVTAFNKKISGFIKTKNEKSTAALFVQRYSDTYLYNHYENGEQSGGKIEYVRLFSIIAIFIVIIACINFMNLTTAKASTRLKEVGIRKVVGAGRSTLVIQYMGESMLLTFISLIITIAMVALLLPQFNQITGKQLGLHLDISLVFAIMGIALITGLISGSYPALYLSGFRPVKILKGKLDTSLGELLARKGLVIFQFTLSVIMIVSVLIIYKQVQLVQTKNLGYVRDHIIYFEKGGKLSNNKDDYKPGGAYEHDLETFIQKLKNIPGVINASNFRHSIVNRHGGTTDVKWPGKAPDNQTEFTDIAAGYDFIETLGIGIKEGRSYSRSFGSEKSKVIFNEAAIESMGLKNPIGKIVNIWGEDREIIGVAKNFHFQSLYENIKPCFFDFSLNQRVSRIMTRIKAGTDRSTIDKIAAFYKGYTGEPLDYTFLDEDYQALYASENRVAVLFRYFAGLTVIISCLGLFGLAAFTAQRRQREIGIRKVLGATLANVGIMLSKEYLKLILIAVCIAFPVSWWATYQWLQGFAYRVNIGAGVFIIAALSIMFITIFTISFQAVKAAVTSPVKSLRTE